MADLDRTTILKWGCEFGSGLNQLIRNSTFCAMPVDFFGICIFVAALSGCPVVMAENTLALDGPFH